MAKRTWEKKLHAVRWSPTSAAGFMTLSQPEDVRGHAALNLQTQRGARYVHFQVSWVENPFVNFAATSRGQCALQRVGGSQRGFSEPRHGNSSLVPGPLLREGMVHSFSGCPRLRCHRTATKFQMTANQNLRECPWGTLDRQLFTDFRLIMSTFRSL